MASAPTTPSVFSAISLTSSMNEEQKELRICTRDYGMDDEPRIHLSGDIAGLYYEVPILIDRDW